MTQIPHTSIAQRAPQCANSLNKQGVKLYVTHTFHISYPHSPKSGPSTRPIWQSFAKLTTPKNELPSSHVDGHNRDLSMPRATPSLA